MFSLKKSFAATIVLAYPNMVSNPQWTSMEKLRLYGVLLSNIAIFILIYCTLFGNVWLVHWL